MLPLSSLSWDRAGLQNFVGGLRDFNPLLNEFLSIFVIVSWMRRGEEWRCLIVSCLKNLASLLLLTLLNMALVLWPSASPEVVTMKLVTPVDKCGFFSSTLTVIFSSFLIMLTSIGFAGHTALRLALVLHWTWNNPVSRMTSPPCSGPAPASNFPSAFGHSRSSRRPSTSSLLSIERLCCFSSCSISGRNSMSRGGECKPFWAHQRHLLDGFHCLHWHALCYLLSLRKLASRALLDFLLLLPALLEHASLLWLPQTQCLNSGQTCSWQDMITLQ